MYITVIIFTFHIKLNSKYYFKKRLFIHDNNVEIIFLSAVSRFHRFNETFYQVLLGEVQSVFITPSIFLRSSTPLPEEVCSI